MNRKNIVHKSKYLILTCILAGFLASCEKGNEPPIDDDTEKIPDDTSPTDESVFYKLIRVANLPGTQENNGENAAPSLFYSLENKNSWRANIALPIGGIFLSGESSTVFFRGIMEKIRQIVALAVVQKEVS